MSQQSSTEIADAAGGRALRGRGVAGSKNKPGGEKAQSNSEAGIVLLAMKYASKLPCASRERGINKSAALV